MGRGCLARSECHPFYPQPAPPFPPPLAPPQATSRVAQVLGPPCAARSGPCQRLLQLSAGPLLAQLAHALSGAAACDGPMEGCAEAAKQQDGGPPQQLLLHSAHDSTLMMLMAGESRQAKVPGCTHEFEIHAGGVSF